ncbi:family 1 glycosylhydrolase [Tundrisphaera sp. TA3]|uniref:family 1 glycosylhydrolase n=1 Tax=Tundrisphaera sp. TA3 TaxID=3435775 RepID=UPI003EB986C9
MHRRSFGPAASDFAWAVGIENTFVPQVRPGHRSLDEYELTGHYEHWREDLDRAAGLGIGTIRYGIPWYRVNPAPGVFDWSWTDPVLEHMAATRGLSPIIDLMHYGTPSWLAGHFADASYPGRVAEYAHAFASRYRSLVHRYTPLNEPGVTAAYCGRLGRWPPYLRGDAGYVRVLLALIRGITTTAQALRAADPGAVLVHVEDAGIEFAASPDLLELAAEAQARRWLPLDLACGRVGPAHPLHGWLVAHGATESGLRELASSVPDWDVLGVNFYPWSNRRLARDRRGVVRMGRDPGRSGTALGPLLRMAHDRYGLPLMVTETSSAGDHRRRARWMDDTISAVRQCRAGGIPVLGYTWFPLFSMVDWKYRRSRKRAEDHLLHLGLWDLAPRQGRLDRDPTPLVERFRRHVDDPAGSVGEVHAPSRPTLPAA